MRSSCVASPSTDVLMASSSHPTFQDRFKISLDGLSTNPQVTEAPHELSWGSKAIDVVTLLGNMFLSSAELNPILSCGTIGKSWSSGSGIGKQHTNKESSALSNVRWRMNPYLLCSSINSGLARVQFYNLRNLPSLEISDGFIQHVRLFSFIYNRVQP